MNPFRPSLRQRVALTLAAMFGVGFAAAAVLAAFGHDLLFRLWGSHTHGCETRM